MANNVELMKKHLQQWEPYRDTWEVNKDQFMARYEKMNVHISVFDVDIGR